MIIYNQMTDTLEKTLEIDPIMDLNFDYHPEEVVYKGTTNKAINQFFASGPSDSNITFQNIAPNDLTQVIERKFSIGRDQLVAVSFPIDSTAGNYPIPFAIAGFSGPRAWLLSAGTPTAPVALPPYVAGQVIYDPVGTGGTWVGIGGGGENGLNYTMCLAPLGLQLSCSNGDLILNNNSRAINLQQNVLLKPYLMDPEDVNFYASSCPCQKDSKAAYVANSAYENNSPFCPPNMNTFVQSRNSFPATLIYEAVNATTVYRIYQYSDIVEPLDISPLLIGKSSNSDGFANLTSIAVKLTISNLYRSISLASNLTIGGTNVNVATSTYRLTWNGETREVSNQQMRLYLTYLDQDAMLAARMKDRLFYDYDDIINDSNVTGLGGSIAGTTPFAGSFTSNSLRVSNNPYKIVYCLTPDPAQMPNGGASSQITNTFLRIKTLTLKYQSRNFLNGWTEEDLYRTSVKNGLKMSWFDWRYGVGSIVILDTAKDLGLPADQAPNMSVQTQIQATISYTNDPLVYAGMPTAVNYTLNTYLISAGKCIISPSKTDYTVGGISSADVIALSTSGENEVDAVAHQAIAKERGGSFLTKAHGLLNKGLQLAKKVKPEHLEMAKDAYNAVKHELSGGEVGGMVVGGKLRKHKRVL